MNQVSNSVFCSPANQGDNVLLRFDQDKALWQGYNPDSKAVSPDWTIAANQPTIKPHGSSSNGGADVPPLGHGSWKYMNNVLQFDSNGLCTNSGLVGVFKRSIVTDLSDPNFDSLQIVKNLASANNEDPDQLYYENNYDNGYSQFASGYVDIMLQPISSSGYYGIVNLDRNVFTTANQGNITATPQLQLGNVVQSGFTCKWKKNDGTVVGTDTTLSITKDMVNSKETFSCEFYVNGVMQTVFYFSIYDMTDPAKIVFVLTTTNSQASKGQQTVGYKASVFQSSTGSVLPSATFPSHNFLNTRRHLISTPASTFVDNGDGTGNISFNWNDMEAVDPADGLINGQLECYLVASY